MNARRPRIVVSLPASRVEELLPQLKRASELGADLAEIRVDRLHGVEPRRLEELFPSPLPLIATVRSRAEGGEGPDAASARAPLLRALADLPFQYLDLELRRDLGGTEELVLPKPIGRIISCHPGPVPSSSWPGLLQELDAAQGIGKLVVPATIEEVGRVLVPLLDRLRGTQVVVHTTGASGPILRALARRFEFPFVFASLPASEGPSVEPSQIPVDRLRPFLEVDGQPPLFAVLGHPVGQSKSPDVHTRWLATEHREGIYLALDPEDERGFLEAVPVLASLGFRGLNVTHPFKAAAMAAASESLSGASRVGACNCLCLEESRWVGENTDLAAMLRRMEELRGSGLWDGGRVTVLGAGGAARATLAAARELGVKAVLHARRREQAESVAEEFGARSGSPNGEVPGGLVVHATPFGGAASAPLEVPLGPLLGPGTHVLDWVYAPTQPTIRRMAESAGATYEDGWRLFVYQAAASYALWWGSPPGKELVAEALKEGGCAG